MTKPHAIDRLSTGICGFDQVALGGLPAGRSALVTGTTGSGKTLFAVEFLARGLLRFDEPGVFVTFEESAEDIRHNAASLGFPIERWESEGKWAFVDGSVDLAEEVSTAGSYDFGGLVARVTHAVNRVGARRVSLDSLDAVFTRYTSEATVRQELFRLTHLLDSRGVTSVLTAERTTEYDGVSRFGVEEFVVNNVIILRNQLTRDRRRRTIEIVKFRGAAHRTGEWLFTIDPAEGIVVIPLAFLTAREHASTVRISSGEAELDRMCGGGFYRDAIVLLTGPSGAGKTFVGLRFAAAASAAGERCLICTFDETADQLARNAAGWGLDLAAMEAAGVLRVWGGYPEVASLEDHLLRIRRTIEEFAPHRLVVDTLSALERIATSRALLDFVIALGGIVRSREITTLLTASPTGRVRPLGTPVISAEILGLTDVTITFRSVERAGKIQRAIAVLQTRGSAHDHRIREVTIDNTGMHIGASVADPGYDVKDNPVAEPRW